MMDRVTRTPAETEEWEGLGAMRRDVVRWLWARENTAGLRHLRALAPRACQPDLHAYSRVSCKELMVIHADMYPFLRCVSRRNGALVLRRRM
jgi:hypothetical protein